MLIKINFAENGHRSKIKEINICLMFFIGYEYKVFLYDWL